MTFRRNERLNKRSAIANTHGSQFRRKKMKKVKNLKATTISIDEEVGEADECIVIVLNKGSRTPKIVFHWSEDKLRKLNDKVPLLIGKALPSLGKPRSYSRVEEPLKLKSFLDINNSTK